MVAIAPNDANILYSPFTWERTAVRAQTVNSGAYLRAKFDGSPASIVMNFDMTGYGSELPQIAWRIDGGPWSNAVVAATVNVAIPTDNTWPQHVVELVVKSTSSTGSRWTAAIINAVRFTGFTISAGTTQPINGKPLTGIVFGDSIVEGLRTLKTGSANPTVDSDATRAWSWLLGDYVGAEVGVVGFASQGWTKPGSGFVPDFTGTWNKLWDGTARPTIDPVAPDFIVINLGTNDGAVNVTTAATSTINAILAAYPIAKVIVMRPFSGDTAIYLQAVVTSIGNPRLTYLDTTGWTAPADFLDGTHPAGFAGLTKIAPRLAKAVEDAVKGKHRWIKKSTGLLPF